VSVWCCICIVDALNWFVLVAGRACFCQVQIVSAGILPRVAVGPPPQQRQRKQKTSK
jgi:hypothetical protein